METKDEGQKGKVRLKVVLPTGETQKHKVSGTEIHIGSGSRNEVQVNDPEISTTHATIVFDGNSYSIVNEAGQGRTFVNDEPVTQQRKLAHGDVITMGKSRISFKLKSEGKGQQPEVVSAAAAAPAAAPLEAIKPAEGHLAATATPTTIEGASETGEKKKKKDKAEKAKDKGKVDERVKAARVRAWGGIIATVLSVVLTVTISLLVTRMGSEQSSGPTGGGSSPKKLGNVSRRETISGGKYEASGAAAVLNANGILFVDDSEEDKVFYMPVNALGEQDGDVKEIPLGVSVENPEGISQFGTRYVIIGSLATEESNNAGGVAVFDLDPATLNVTNAKALTGMRKFLLENVPELRAWANKTSAEGGLNVEGIATDPNPQNPRVLLGLRGPVPNGNALIVPIKQRDRNAPFSIENLEMAEPNAIQVNLGGQAIRDIQYASPLRSFLIISGAPEYEEKGDFSLWEWTGDSNQAHEDARPRMQTALDKKMKPEGIASLKIGSQEFVFVVGDANSYVRIDYLTR